MSTTIQTPFTSLITPDKAEIIRILLRLGRPATTNEIKAQQKSSSNPSSKVHQRLHQMRAAGMFLHRTIAYLDTGWCLRPFVLWQLTPTAKTDFQSLIE